MNTVRQAARDATLDATLDADPSVAALAVVGESEAMREIFRLIERVGPTDASVLLTGESGSGKELAARSIHDRSMRRSAQFVTLNCGAVPTDLIEAELFRYDKGAMAGVERMHAGVFERACGGTLFLDEVTEMPLEMQTRLLRALETRRFYKVGATMESACDVRVIASTNRCPLDAVRNGLLREDLLYRLAVFPIELPPLRDRGGDVNLLADHFLSHLNQDAKTQKRLSAASRMTLIQHTWPGNVRELRNCVERAFILGDQVLELSPLIQNLGKPQAAATGERLDIRVGSRIHDMERSLIEATLNYFKGNKRHAADALGCSLKTLYNKLNGYSQSQECASS